VPSFFKGQASSPERASTFRLGGVDAPSVRPCGALQMRRSWLQGVARQAGSTRPVKDRSMLRSLAIVSFRLWSFVIRSSTLWSSDRQLPEEDISALSPSVASSSACATAPRALDAEEWGGRVTQWTAVPPGRAPVPRTGATVVRGDERNRQQSLHSPPVEGGGSGRGWRRREPRNEERGPTTRRRSTQLTRQWRWSTNHFSADRLRGWRWSLPSLTHTPWNILHVVLLRSPLGCQHLLSTLRVTVMSALLTRPSDSADRAIGARRRSRVFARGRSHEGSLRWPPVRGDPRRRSPGRGR